MTPWRSRFLASIRAVFHLKPPPPPPGTRMCSWTKHQGRILMLRSRALGDGAARFCLVLRNQLEAKEEAAASPFHRGGPIGMQRKVPLHQCLESTSSGRRLSFFRVS